LFPDLTPGNPKPSLSKALHGENIMAPPSALSATCLASYLLACFFAPGDLKPSLSKALNAILEPVRRHFVENKEAAALLKQVRSYKVTR
jgi:hypothetical protein